MLSTIFVGLSSANRWQQIQIQMLQDPDRGSAWTAALVGVPAKTVYVCGSNAVTRPCMNVLAY